MGIKREGHKCPRCAQWTTKSFYCQNCAEMLRKPGHISGRKPDPYFREFSKGIHGAGHWG